MRVNEIQEQIGCGEYQVDTLAVADAIVRLHLQELMGSAPEAEGSQEECS
jgi:hypothetical protein